MSYQYHLGSKKKSLLSLKTRNHYCTHRSSSHRPRFKAFITNLSLPMLNTLASPTPAPHVVNILHLTGVNIRYTFAYFSRLDIDRPSRTVVFDMSCMSIKLTPSSFFFFFSLN